MFTNFVKNVHICSRILHQELSGNPDSSRTPMGGLSSLRHQGVLGNFTAPRTHQETSMSQIHPYKQRINNNNNNEIIMMKTNNNNNNNIDNNNRQL